MKPEQKKEEKKGALPRSFVTVIEDILFSFFDWLAEKTDPCDSGPKKYRQR